MVYDSYTGFSSEFTKLPIEIYTTDELCTEIIRRICGGERITGKMELLQGLIFTESVKLTCKKFAKSTVNSDG